MKKNKGLFVGILLSVIAIVAFGSTFFIYREEHHNEEEHHHDHEHFTVVTSFYPMYIATANVMDGVEHVDLKNLSEPETGCLHDYQLTPEDVKLLSTADVFIVNGGGIEPFLTEVAKTNPELIIIDASERISLLEDNAHVWMSVADHKKQVENIAEGLAKADREHGDIYRENGQRYMEKLEALEQQIAEGKKQYQGTQVVLFHEAYAYVARDFGLEVAGVMDLDEERHVSAGEVSDMMALLQEEKVPLVLAEEAYGKEMGDMVDKETTATAIYLETLVRGQYDKDSYLIQMQSNIDKIVKQLNQ